MARKAHIASDNEVNNESISRPNNSTRSSKGRAGLTRGITGRIVNEAKVRQYEETLNQSRLEIPEDVRERFTAEDMHIGWVRYMEKGAEDSANIYRKCQKMGFQFVTEDEVPEMALGYQSATVKGNDGTLVTEGDLALAKIHNDDYFAIQEAKARKVARVSQGILGNKPKGVLVSQQSFITKGQRKEADLLEDAADVLDNE